VSVIQVDNLGVDSKYFEFLCECWVTPVNQTLNIGLAYLGEGKAGVRIMASHEYSTVRGRLHGGIISTVLDTAMGWALLSRGYSPVTSDMYLNYLASVFEGTGLIAEAEVIHIGNRSSVVQGTMRDDQGQLVATSRATFVIKEIKLRSEL